MGLFDFVKEIGHKLVSRDEEPDLPRPEDPHPVGRMGSKCIGLGRSSFILF
jgi:hypothetical protein